MGRNFTRKEKNHILILVNLLALALYGIKIWSYDLSLSMAEMIWMITVLPVTVLNLIPGQAAQSRRFAHVLLFLCTGGILGITVGALIRKPESLLFLDYFWLIIAFVAVFIHYSKSKTDIYRNP